MNASADGTRLLTVGHDRLTLWEVASGARVWAGQDLGIGFHGWGALSADGGFALAVGEGQGLYRWTFEGRDARRDVVTLDCDQLIGTCGLMGLAILDDGVAIGAASGEVRRADPATGRTELLHAVHESGVRALQLSPDRRRLLSFSENGVAAVYDLAEGRLCTPAAMAGVAVPAAAFTPSGDLTWMDGDGALRVIDAEALDAAG